MPSEPTKESLRYFHNWMMRGEGEQKTWPVEMIRDVARIIDEARTDLVTRIIEAVRSQYCVSPYEPLAHNSVVDNCLAAIRVAAEEEE